MNNLAPGKLVLQLASIGPRVDQALFQEFGVVRLWEQDASSWMREHSSDIAAVVTSVRKGCDASLIAALPSLKAICSWGVGYDTIAIDAARARNIQVSNTPDVLDDCVADLAWGLMISVARNICLANDYVKSDRWLRLGEFPLSTRVSGKRLGILGLGRIGRAIARRGDGFEMQVRYHGRTRQQDASYKFEPSLEDLAAWCDFLVIACVGGKQTFHLVDAKVLSALGPRGILVNIARGSVVDQAALVKALREGRIGGAGLDTVENEPGAPTSLRENQKVVLTPHVGSATLETRVAMEESVLSNLKSFLLTGRVLTPVIG